MTEEIITRVRIRPSEGNRLTDGIDVVDVVYLAEGASKDKWYEVSESEAEAILNEKQLREEAISDNISEEDIPMEFEVSEIPLDPYDGLPEDDTGSELL